MSNAGGEWSLGCFHWLSWTGLFLPRWRLEKKSEDNLFFHQRSGGSKKLKIMVYRI